MTINVKKLMISLLAIALNTSAVSAGEETAAQQTSDESKNSMTDQQDATEENWYGTLERFNKHPIQVKYKIKRQASGATNAELIINKESFALDGFIRGELDNATGKFVRFRFKPGGIKEVECLLTLSDGESKGYAGLCPPDAAFDTTGVRRLTMHRSSDETNTGDTKTDDSSEP